MRSQTRKKSIVSKYKYSKHYLRRIKIFKTLLTFFEKKNKALFINLFSINEANT